MLTPNFAFLVRYFYPVGNTPAVCLTQSIPPDSAANLLLLGCGDVRNILFTVHTDDRRMDITCCDGEECILARNAILLTLIADSDSRMGDRLWNIYYHMYLDEKCLGLVQAQAKKLYDLAGSMHTWRDSKYGRLITFCDVDSLAQIRGVWKFYATKRTGADLAAFEVSCKRAVSRARSMDRARGLNLTAIRSVAPACLADTGIMDYLPRLHEHFWAHGTTDMNSSNNGDTAARGVYFNPMFATQDKSLLLHYGTNPLLGFHLSIALASLEAGSPLSLPSDRRNTGAQALVDAAKTEFRAWCTSFRKRTAPDAPGGLFLRFFSGDAIAFPHVLQHRRACPSDNSHGWYRERCHFKPLVLWEEDYGAGGAAPASFHVIDTSNLIDHVGSLNLLVAAAPLLENGPSASLYTEKLVRADTTHKGLAGNLLCGHLPTIATLLGLLPAEYLANTSTMSVGDEIFMDSGIRGQMYIRITWKRPATATGIASCLSPAQVAQCAGSISLTARTCVPTTCMHFDETALARLFFDVFVDVFSGVDLPKSLSNMSLAGINKLELPKYHRGSFVALLRFVQLRVSVDWEKTMGIFLDHLERDDRFILGSHYAQEMYLHMHILGVHSVDVLRVYQNIAGRDLPATGPGGDRRNLRGWENIPSIVSVTLVVPTAKLAVLTSLLGEDPVDDRQKRCGYTPALDCQLRGPEPSIVGWHSIFAAVQLGFGDLRTSGERNTDGFCVEVDEDLRGWHGDSSLLASFRVPSWLLLKEPQGIRVALGIRSSPDTAYAFASVLGLELTLYETNLRDTEHVYITEHPPHLTAFMPVCGFAHGGVSNGEYGGHHGRGDGGGSSDNSGQEVSACITASVDCNISSSSISSLTCRFNFVSEDLRSILRTGCRISSSFTSPSHCTVTLGRDHVFEANFPMPVVEQKCKTRVARKSSWIELVVPAATGTSWMASLHSYHTYPVFIDHGVPTVWNIPYVNWATMPLLDVSQPAKLAWLNWHVSTMVSAREFELRNAPRTSVFDAERARLDLKESLILLYIGSTGQHGRGPHRIFGIVNEETCSAPLLVVVSGLRLDLSNRTVVLDAAVLPFHHQLPKITTFLRALRDFRNIKASAAEMRLWKQMLPAWVERCRTWSHKAGKCEYEHSAGTIPLSVDDESPMLCNCGNGVGISDDDGERNFVVPGVTNLPGWRAASRLFVRAAISPMFFCALVDEPHLPDFQRRPAGTDPAVAVAAAAATGRGKEEGGETCRACGKDGARNETGGLRTCSGCGLAKYCSRACQRADWKNHKAGCKVVGG